MGAVASAVSVVGGVVGLSQQQQQASAQKRAIESQSQQAALQAQLQLLALKQQTYADTLNDTIADATRTLQYEQATTQLYAQEQLNAINTANALFDSSMQRAAADINQMQGDNQALLQQSSTEEQIGNQTTGALGQANEQQNSVIQSVMQLLGQGSKQQDTIANLLDVAASSGGVNEALSLLLGNSGDEIQAAFDINRGGQLQEQMYNDALALDSSGRALADVTRRQAQTNNAIIGTQGRQDADRQTIDATYGKQVADQSFKAANAVNKANFNIGVLSDSSARFSRDYLRQYNEGAIMKGAQLQQDILKAQADQVRTPGFLDYVNVGIGGYNTYRQFEALK